MLQILQASSLSTSSGLKCFKVLCIDPLQVIRIAQRLNITLANFWEIMADKGNVTRWVSTFEAIALELPEKLNIIVSL